MAGNRFRYVDYAHWKSLNDDTATQLAADEIINHSEKHLLTQTQLLAAEGGLRGLLVQVGFVGLGLGTLFLCQSKLFRYLQNTQLRALEWGALGLTGFVSYRVGYNMGARWFGERQKVKNHWMAYFYVKQLNRFEGRQILSKSPFTY